ncbi:uncharacterized protein LOC123270524 [Cotesia glomerata]|uniref:uncharacterized protein LOC123270524 n=1 Tax=Cotesia glomerata TaxID=32391 RepID=UPI001D02B694|nr:uncharacterized protein LOC123270524 [Cotesia glomerata]
MCSSIITNIWYDEFSLYFELKITEKYLVDIIDTINELFNIKLGFNARDVIVSQWRNKDIDYTPTYVVYNRYMDGFSYETIYCQNANHYTNGNYSNMNIDNEYKQITDFCFRTNCPYFAVIIELFYMELKNLSSVYYILADFYSWATVVVANHARPRTNVQKIHQFSSYFSPLLVNNFHYLFDQSVTYIHLNFNFRNEKLQNKISLVPIKYFS